MRALCIITLAGLGCGPALAQPTPMADYRQSASSDQIIHNSVDLRTLEALTDDFMQTMLGAPSLGSLSQSGSNLVNSVSSGGDLNTVVQRFDGTQRIDNALSANGVTMIGALVQSGDNLAGTIEGRTINLADQLLGASAEQLIYNAAQIGLLYGSVTQKGTNSANMAIADYSIGTANQEIVAGAVQRVDNRLALAASASLEAYIRQSGVNLGNTMQSDTVESVRRVFAGDQIINNRVELAALGGGAIVQSGTNIANYVESSRIGAIEQVSTGVQQVNNEIRGPDGQLISGQDYFQIADNVVNLTVLTAPENGNSDADILVDQSADYPQSSTGGNGSNSQTGNSVSIVR